MKIRKHCTISHSVNCYELFKDGVIIHELIPAVDLEEFLLITGAKLTEEKFNGVKWPKSEHEKFYKI